MPPFERLPLQLLIAPLAIAVLLLSSRAGLKVAALGFLALLLGATSLLVAIPGATTSATVDEVVLRGGPPVFLAINSAFLLVGWVMIAGSAVMSLVKPAGVADRWLGLVALLVALLVLGAALPLFVLFTGGYTLLAALGLVLGALGLYSLGTLSRVGDGVRWLDRQVMGRWRWTWPTRPMVSLEYGLVIVGLMAAALVLFGTNLWLVVGGALVVASVTHALTMRIGAGVSFPFLPILAASLVPAALTVARTGEGLGSSWEALGNAHLSAAAEITVVPLIALSAYAFGALWPFHGLVVPGMIAPIGAALLARLGVGLLPAGILYWQPVLIPFALWSVWWGALTGRGVLLVTGLAFMMIVTAIPSGLVGAGWLLAIGALMTLAAARPFRHTGRAIVNRLFAGAFMVGITVGAPALLETELVYTLLAFAAIGVAIVGHWGRLDSSAVTV